MSEENLTKDKKQKIIDAINFVDENNLSPIFKYGYMMNCPFHEEKTPSFLIYRNDFRYFCFSCQAKGYLKNKEKP